MGHSPYLPAQTASNAYPAQTPIDTRQQARSEASPNFGCQVQRVNAKVLLAKSVSQYKVIPSPQGHEAYPRAM